MTVRIIVTPTSLCKAPQHLSPLVSAGYDVCLNERRHPLTESELAEMVTGAAGLIVGTEPVTREVMDRAGPSLRVIARYGTGTDNVDLVAASQRGIVVTNTPGANRIAVAELTLALMFALARHIPMAHDGVRRGGWERPLGMELRGKVLGLVGAGRIGIEVARLARAVGMNVVYYDWVRRRETEEELGLRFAPMEDLLPQADVISLHVPLTESTRHLIGAKQLARLKPGALLINTARGGIIDEVALVQALDDGRIGGAALDVFEHEPPGLQHPLVGHPKVIHTPHLGARTREAVARMAHGAVTAVMDVLAGRRPLHVVNPEVYENRQD
ncbi:MAG: phosphoglycerate dehydrogenase [Firmicutes bacterium]|nr:phosphoglycerate dehydrogenase [Bacillota bacterium]